MSCPREPFPCSLFVIVPGSDRSGPDVAPLARALRHRLDSVVVAVWTDGSHGIDLATTERAAAVLDDLRLGTGQRVKYVELTADLGDAVAGLVRHRRGSAVVTVASSAPRRVRSAVRRAAARGDAHVALVPERRPDRDAVELLR